MERYDLLPGTVGDEGAFDKMEPKEAKYRLGLIAKRMDKNLDGYVSREELTDWIVMSYRYVYIRGIFLKHRP